MNEQDERDYLVNHYRGQEVTSWLAFDLWADAGAQPEIHITRELLSFDGAVRVLVRPATDARMVEAILRTVIATYPVAEAEMHQIGGGKPC